MKPTLLVLAAGMGSRYGSLKQMDGVGPNGEAILDYSIYDAKRAGFGKVVFVIRKDFAEVFEKVNSAERYGMPVEYVYQQLDKLPEGFSVPEGRVKPWGTNHAVLMAAEVIKEPFAVINADDFYGREAYETLAEYLRQCEGKTGEYSMVAYKLRNTMSDYGTVSRGICTKTPDGYLQSLVERTAIAHDKKGGAEYTDEEGTHPIDIDSLVSMNFFGFTPDYFAESARGFVEFLKNLPADNLKSEFYMPMMVNNLINAGKARLKVLSSNASWFGVTYKEDKPEVMRKIKALVEKGVYPEQLWK